jgi:hypothetical protein
MKRKVCYLIFWKKIRNILFVFHFGELTTEMFPVPRKARGRKAKTFHEN